MQEIDEKLDSVHEKIHRESDRLTSEIEKSENRSKNFTIERYDRLIELIEKGNAIRLDQLNIEISRLQKTNEKCGENCAAVRKGFNDRLLLLERWKELNWQRLLVYASVGVVAAIKVLEWFGKLLK